MKFSRAASPASFHSVARLLWGIALATVVSGCGDSTPHRIPLHGRVTFKGKPVEDGTLSLLPESDFDGPPITGVIRNGSYSISESNGPTIGHYRVEIEGYRKTGRQIPDMASPDQERKMIDEKLPYLPDKFNANSTVAADVTAETKELNFDLNL